MTTEPLSAVLDRASAVLGPETGADVRQARAILHEALMQAQEIVLGHRKFDPITIDQADALDKFVGNMLDRRGRAHRISKAAERAVQGEIIPQAQEAA